ncbi:MAG: alanine--glyoxylate aminotransferase family protein [Deltaproteobacteria bacterium]|nr:MAG: alanine--glyoxylate aminotransferase family protein [Deltaproteobacteria bacterium]
MTHPPERILLGPGPSDVPARVLAALARPTVGHLDPAFLALMDELRARLRALFRTTNDLTLAVSGTGSAGMEAAIANVVEPGDRVLVAVQGAFGGRLAEVARRCGAKVETIDVEWGRAFDPADLVRAIRDRRPAVFAVVHAETSTGVRQPLDGIADAVHDAGGLLVVDCVTSLGGMPVEVDAWGIDVAYSGSQKCLSCPPGLAPITLSPRAVAKLDARRAPVQSWYLDLSLVRNYWGGDRAYHHTAPVNMLYALHEAVGMALEEGLDERFTRHARMHARLVAGLDALGLSLLPPADVRLPMLNAVCVPGRPDAFDERAVRARLLADYGIEIGGGLGALAGRVWRVGLMGHAATARNVDLLLAALDRTLAAA